MVRLKISEIDDYIYKLIDDNKKIYIFNLEFIDIKKDIKEGDFIIMPAELLNPKYEGYSTNYTFGEMDSIYGKNNLDINSTDVIMVETSDENKYYKRLYG